MRPTTPTGSGTVKSMPVNGYGLMLSPADLVGPSRVVAEPLGDVVADEIRVDVAALQRGDRADVLGEAARSAARRISTSRRASGFHRRHSANAALAAATASSTSATDAIANVLCGLPVAGLTWSIVPPSESLTQRSPMSSPLSSTPVRSSAILLLDVFVSSPRWHEHLA